MPNYGQSRQERVYLVAESTFGQAVKPTGANYCRHIKCTLNPTVDLIVRPDKTGSRTRTQGTAGRRIGAWSLQMSLAPGAAAGSKPDMDPVLAALFGQAATVTAGTSVLYALSDAIPSFSLWRYRTPASLVQQLGVGCVVREATFTLGQDVAEVTFSGSCLWVADSAQWSTLDSVGKGGLADVSFPVEPASPVSNGNFISGFKGACVADGNTMTNAMRSATVKLTTGNDLPRDWFGQDYPGTPEGDVRDVTTSFSLYDSDDAGVANLYAKATSKTPINISFTIGNVAGARYVLALKGVQLATPSLDDGQRKWSANFGDSAASGSSVTALDEVTLTIN